MHKKSIILCALTCIAGIFGAFIRWLQRTSAFEPDTGLAVPGALWSTVLLVFFIAGAIVFLPVARRTAARNKLGEGAAYPEVFAGGLGKFTTVVAAIAMALICLGGLLSLVSGGHAIIDIVGGGAAIAAGICLFLMLRGTVSSRSGGGRTEFIVILLYLCFRLVNEYRSGASNPVIWSFAPQIISIAATILAYYYFAGYSFERPKPARTLYFALLAVFLSIPTLADDLPLGYQMITAGFLLGTGGLTLLFAEQTTVDN